MKRRRSGDLARLAAAASAAAVLIVTATGARPAAAQGGPLRQAFVQRFVGRPAPAFALKDTDGKLVRLADQRGKVVLLNFWYSGCLPCRKETPDLASLYRLRKSIGLVVLGLNLDDVLIPEEGGALRQSFLREFAVPYPVLIADRPTYEAYGSIPVQPISFVIDRGGKIVKVLWGAAPGAAFDHLIAPYLAEPQGA